MATNWDAAAKNAHALLSNGNLTVVGDASSGLHFAGRSVAGGVVGSGVKRYWEITIVSVGGVNDAGVGVASAAETFGDGEYLGSQAAGIGYYDSGAVFYNTTPGVMGAAFAAGDIVCVALVGWTKVWFRVNGGNWYNDGLANPATNTGGIDISVAIAADIYPAYAVRNAGSQTANFGATAFAFAVPSGFTGFDSPPATGTLNVTEAADTLSATGSGGVTVSATRGGPALYPKRHWLDEAAQAEQRRSQEEDADAAAWLLIAH